MHQPYHREVCHGLSASLACAADGTVSGTAGDTPATSRTSAEANWTPELPESAWPILIELAAGTLSTIKPDDLPGQLRRFARFAPAKRAKPAAGPLRSELTGDPIFRQRVADRIVAASPVAAAVAQGDSPKEATAAEVAALAFLIRPEGWQDMVRAAARHEESTVAETEVRNRIAQAEQRATTAEHDRAIAEREAEKLRVELTELRAEVDELRRQHRSATKETREVKRRERKVTDALSAERGRLRQAETSHATEVQQLRSQLHESLQALERARRGARDTRAFNESRLWLLLETIGGAAQGLRQELALEPAETTPADFIADVEGVRPGAGASSPARGLEADDPIRLDELLALPRAHLIIDGYNVTKGGWPELTLEQQRSRLGRGLSGLAAQTGAEVTVVYDGADPMVGLPKQPRGVRVLFSRKGQTADEVIRALVRGEPNGRPVIVISSDREVADGTRRNGAYPLSSDTLRRRLQRALSRPFRSVGVPARHREDDRRDGSGPVVSGPPTGQAFSGPPAAERVGLLSDGGQQRDVLDRREHSEPVARARFAAHRVSPHQCRVPGDRVDVPAGALECGQPAGRVQVTAQVRQRVEQAGRLGLSRLTHRLQPKSVGIDAQNDETREAPSVSLHQDHQIVASRCAGHRRLQGESATTR